MWLPHIVIRVTLQLQLISEDISAGARNVLFGLLEHLTADRIVPWAQKSVLEMLHPRPLLPGLTIAFIRQFALGLWGMFPLLFALALAVTLLGQAVGRKEGWTRLDSFYWSFITATAVGYGDIRPVKRKSKLLAILIAFFGLTLNGIIIAIAVQASTEALNIIRNH